MTSMTYFSSFPSVSIVDFEQVNISLECCMLYLVSTPWESGFLTFSGVKCQQNDQINSKYLTANWSNMWK